MTDVHATCASLPGAIRTYPFGEETAVYKVGGKVFCLVGATGGAIACQVSEASFAGLTELPGITPAPSFARGQWVSVAPGALPEADLAAYLRQAHRLIAAKLTRKLRAELGLE